MKNYKQMNQMLYHKITNNFWNQGGPTKWWCDVFCGTTQWYFQPNMNDISSNV